MKARREHVHRRISQSLACFALDGDYFDAPYHFHPEIEIALIHEGSGTRIIGDAMANFKDRDLCLIGGNLPHLYCGQQPAGMRARAEVIQFSRDEWDGLFDTLPEMRRIGELLDRSARALRFPDALIPEVTELMQRTREAADASRIVIFLELLDLLSRKMEDALPLISPGYHAEIDHSQSERIDLACQFIIEHASEDLSHAEVAARTGLSPSAFSRLFHKATGMTYTRFLNEVRLGHAARLLMETELPIAQIAFETGFNNLSNFNRRFRDHYGRAPSQYRKNLLSQD